MIGSYLSFESNFNLKAKNYDPPMDIVRDLKMIEENILKGLNDLLKMAEGSE